MIGLGGGGSNAINRMIASRFTGVTFAVANTDAQAMRASPAPIKIQLGAKLTGGLGADLFVLTHEPSGINDFEVITDLNQSQGDHLLLAIEGLTGSDGSIEASRVGLLSFHGGSLLLADLDHNVATGIDGHEAVLARLDGVDSSVDPHAVLASILDNQLV